VIGAVCKATPRIFIWIPKTGGTSLWNALPLQHRIKILTLNEVREHPAAGLYTFGHISLFLLTKRGLLRPEFVGNAFKFAFVRNPFDRAVSLFEFSKQRRTLPPRTTFQRFCELLKERAYEPLGLYNKRGLSQCNPQCAWIKRGDASGCDFIGRYENLQHDFNKVCEMLALEGKPPRLQWLNKSNRVKSDAYYRPMTAALIRQAYEEDFDTFKYSNKI
jgi:hypothetical protein